MKHPRSAQAFNAVIGLVGVAAVLSGLFVIATGGGAIPGGDGAAPSVDSELRLLAVFWTGFGLLALRIAPRAAGETATVRALSLALFAGGAARVISWMAVGRPAPGIAAVTVIELVAPIALVAWQRAVTGGAETAPPEP